MFAIDKKSMETTIVTIKEKLINLDQVTECIADIEALIEIKQSHLWRSGFGSCCGSISNLSSFIETEIEILQDSVKAIRGGDKDKAATLLENYIAFVKKNYEDEHVVF